MTLRQSSVFSHCPHPVKDASTAEIITQMLSSIAPEYSEYSNERAFGSIAHS